MDDQKVSGDLGQGTSKFYTCVCLADADGGVVATLNLDEAAADVCKRCSKIPWINASQKYSSTLVWTFAPNCRICRLLESCTPYAPEEASIVLKWTCAPDRLRRHLEKHKFKLDIIRVRELKSSAHNGVAILVSDLSLEQAELALQPLSISPVMSLSKIGGHIRDCVNFHWDQTCALRGGRNPLHLRVIDCDTLTVVDAPANCDFVALSYVWGRVRAAQNPDITQDIPLTVRHSICVTVKLGFKYLWIDQYVSIIVYSLRSITKRT